MAAEHESLRLNAALMRLGLRDWLPGFREFGVSEGEIAGGTGANDFGTDPAFACAAPGTGPPPPPSGECIHVNRWQLAAFPVTRRCSRSCTVQVADRNRGGWDGTEDNCRARRRS